MRSKNQHKRTRRTYKQGFIVRKRAILKLFLRRALVSYQNGIHLCIKNNNIIFNPLFFVLNEITAKEKVKVKR